MAGYIGSKAVNLSTTGADINGNANIDGDLSFGDNDKAIFGAGSDLQIYHDGSHSYVKDNGTGDLKLQGNNLYLQNASGETYLGATSDGLVFLRYDNSTKLATTSTGVDVTGTLVSDGLVSNKNINSATIPTLRSDYQVSLEIDGAHTGQYVGGIAFGDQVLGTAQAAIAVLDRGASAATGLSFATGNSTAITERMRIDDIGDISFYEDTGTTPKFFWDASAERLFVGDNTTNMPSAVTGAGLMVTGTSPTGADGGQLVIKSSELTSDAGNGGGLVFDNYNGVGNRVFGAIQVLKENSTSNNNDSYMRFTTRSNSSGLAERMRIDSSGNVLINKTSAFVDEKFTCNGGSTRAAAFGTDGTSNFICISIHNGNGAVGSITTSGSSTSYNTSSDHRLKENVVELTGATERLKQLNPSRFNFIADANTTVDGFIAHEVQTVVPEAITGTHNEVDADGNPVYQGIDQSKLVPLLTAALQEALDEITDLKARVATLEAN